MERFWKLIGGALLTAALGTALAVQLGRTPTAVDSGARRTPAALVPTQRTHQTRPPQGRTSLPAPVQHEARAAAVAIAPEPPAPSFKDTTEERSYYTQRTAQDFEAAKALEEAASELRDSVAELRRTPGQDQIGHAVERRAEELTERARLHRARAEGYLARLVRPG